MFYFFALCKVRTTQLGISCTAFSFIYSLKMLTYPVEDILYDALFVLLQLIVELPGCPDMRRPLFPLIVAKYYPRQ